MALHPAVQEKAQAEIDRVVGRDRLPEAGDRESLPYLEAVYREVMRWRPALPLALPHCVVQDDNYQGYVIPKGKTRSPVKGSPTHKAIGRCLGYAECVVSCLFSCIEDARERSDLRMCVEQGDGL